MSKRDLHRDLLRVLGEQGMLDYGASIPRSLVHEVLGIQMPEVASKSTYDRLALVELSAIDYVRNALIEQGRYIAGTPTGYRILLPSENAIQVENYMDSADRKLSRALKLSRCTQIDSAPNPDQTEARILMKRHGMRKPHSGESPQAH